MKKVFCVISHTHWDREWYLNFESFRIKLVDLIDNLLDILESNYEYRFHLDAQTIVLEDYLRIKPQNENKLKQYITQGRILVGPWYIQNDFFLTSGEAIVRNLAIGTKIAESFGKCTKVGYVPDQFGLISQIPQIFKKSGIDTCLFGRGFDFSEPRCAEFIWKGEDGSEILSVHMPLWYNNAQRFSSDIDKAIKMIKINQKNLQSKSAIPYYLLMNGVDHLEAQENLLPILHNINERLPEGESIIQDTMHEYMKKLKDSIKGIDIDKYTGEMRNGYESNILPGTLSSRVYLKQWNIRCQILLEKKIEPLYSLLHILGINDYPHDFLMYLWKSLLQNHAHDSICGCSVDRVHEQMVDRFKVVKEAGEQLLNRGMDALASHINREKLNENQYIITVFNSSQAMRSGIEEIVLEFIEEEVPNVFCITDSLNHTIPFVIIEKNKEVKRILSPINLPGMVRVVTYRILLWVDEVQGLGYKTYIVTPSNMGNVQFEKESWDDSIMDNKYLRVEIQSNGTINLLEKESNNWYRNLLLLEDREDTGDSYIYRNDSNSKPILSTCAKAIVTKIQDNELINIRKVSYKISLPARYLHDESRRSDEKINVPINITLKLKKNSRRLDVSIEINNKVKDHRLRALFPTGVDTDISFAGSPFDVVARDKSLVSEGIVRVGEQPNTTFVNVDGKDCGIAIFNEGLYEYEHLDDSENTIAMTLLRGNGFITNDQQDLAMTKNGLVPGNQCLGVHILNLAIYPHSGNYIEDEVPRKAQDFNNPLLVYCYPVDTRKFAGGRPFVQGSDISEIFYRKKKYPNVNLPLSTEIATIEGKDVVLSCTKLTNNGDDVILRLYNISSNYSNFTLTLSVLYSKAFIVNLLEVEQKEVKLHNRRALKIQLTPKEIITLKLVKN